MCLEKNPCLKELGSTNLWVPKKVWSHFFLIHIVLFGPRKSMGQYILIVPKKCGSYIFWVSKTVIPKICWVQKCCVQKLLGTIKAETHIFWIQMNIGFKKRILKPKELVI